LGQVSHASQGHCLKRSFTACHAFVVGQTHQAVESVSVSSRRGWLVVSRGGQGHVLDRGWDVEDANQRAGAFRSLLFDCRAYARRGAKEAGLAHELSEDRCHLRNLLLCVEVGCAEADSSRVMDVPRNYAVLLLERSHKLIRLPPS
jgi:hypothetical protein